VFQIPSSVPVIVLVYIFVDIFILTSFETLVYVDDLLQFECETFIRNVNI